MAKALADGFIASDTTILDYGCGRGGDVALLRQLGFRTSGWDPYFAPAEECTPADVVNLGYVLNVIPDTDERRRTLLRAYRLARSVLVLAVRIEEAIAELAQLRYGCYSELGTFQKYYLLPLTPDDAVAPDLAHAA
jgi:DNA phosphorothioation-associated putative methyltransferase